MNEWWEVHYHEEMSTGRRRWHRMPHKFDDQASAEEWASRSEEPARVAHVTVVSHIEPAS